jgi:hypothetical protein
VKRPGSEFLRQPHLLVAVLTRGIGPLTEARSGKVDVGEEEDDGSTVALTKNASVAISQVPCPHVASDFKEALERHPLIFKTDFRVHSAILPYPHEGLLTGAERPASGPVRRTSTGRLFGDLAMASPASDAYQGITEPRELLAGLTGNTLTARVRFQSEICVTTAARSSTVWNTASG